MTIRDRLAGGALGHAALNTVVPEDFQREMHDQHLVSPDAPLRVNR
jgi:hypothetical protein